MATNHRDDLELLLNFIDKLKVFAAAGFHSNGLPTSAVTVFGKFKDGPSFCLTDDITIGKTVTITAVMYPLTALA